MEELQVLQECELSDEVGSLKFLPPPMKKSDTRESISSVDSDVSLSFDRRGSKGEETDADFSDSDSSGLENTERTASLNRVTSRAKLQPRHKANNNNSDNCVDAESGTVENDGTLPVNAAELSGTRPSDVTLRIHDATERDDKKATIDGESVRTTLDHAADRKTTDEEDEEDETPQCSDELAEKISAQVEFYLSDESIVKDAFLLKHVKRNKEGWVSLKLISSFKRVKHLSRDWRIVGTALRSKSTKLEVNELGTKLRRKNPLPPYDQTMPSRTVLATRLPLDKLCVESVAELFSQCGEIVLIRVLRPGNPTPTEVRHAIEKRPELATSEECALIEFTDSAAARSAMRMPLGDARVYELQSSLNTEKKRKQVHQKQQIPQQQSIVTTKKSAHTVTRENTYNSSSCASGSEAEDPRISRNGKYTRPHPACHHMPFGPAHNFRGPPSTEAWLARRLSSSSVTGLDNTGNGLILRRLSSCSGSGSGSDTGGGGTYPARRFSCSSGIEAGCGGGGVPPGIMCDHHISHNGSQNPAQVYPPMGYCGQGRRFSCCSASGSVSGSPTTGYGWNYEYTNANSISSPTGGRRGSGADCGPFLRRLSSCSRDSGFFDQTNRRLSSCSSSSESCSGQFRPRSNSSFVLMAHLPENVTRMPSGPDGTRGFGRLLSNLPNHHRNTTQCSLTAVSSCQ